MKRALTGIEGILTALYAQSKSWARSQGAEAKRRGGGKGRDARLNYELRVEHNNITVIVLENPHAGCEYGVVEQKTLWLSEARATAIPYPT